MLGVLQARASTARPSAATRWPARSAPRWSGCWRTGEFQRRSAELGERLHAGLAALVGQGVVAVRGRGLWAGVDIDPALMTGRQACERLAERGVLAKDTHGSTIRLAPPLVVTEDETGPRGGPAGEAIADAEPEAGGSALELADRHRGGLGHHRGRAGLTPPVAHILARPTLHPGVQLHHVGRAPARGSRRGPG